jgi:hypothetical protein
MARADSRRREVVQRFAVEFDHRTAGIAVRVPGGFMFYSGHDDFDELDGRLFGRARAIQRQLEKLVLKRRRGRQPGFLRLRDRGDPQ